MIQKFKIRYHRTIWITTIILLIISGTTILAAGYLFIFSQPGREMQGAITIYQQPHSDDLFIRGVILFFIVSLAGVIISVIALLKQTLYPLLISLWGIALLLWIIAQVEFIGFFHPLLIAIGIASILLIPAGYFLKEFNR